MECKDLRVLVVEDEEENRNFVHRILKRRVREIYLAEDGIEGLKLYEKYRPDVVITDIVMPNMDGIEMVSHIKKNRDDIPPVIIATAYRGDEYHCDLANEHVFKPFTADELIKRVFTLSECHGLI